MSEKRIYELTAQDKLNSDDYFAVDKSGNTTAKKVPGAVIVDQFADMHNYYGAKNIAPSTNGTKTTNGLTFTVNSDKSVTVTGTASADTIFYIDDDIIPIGHGSYKISGCPAGGTSATYSIICAFYSGTTWKGNPFITEEGLLVNIGTDWADTDGFKLGISIKNGTAMGTGGKTFYPMIRFASIQDDTYVPFTKTNKELTGDVASLNSALNKDYSISSRVNITTYTSSNKYTCPSDGYITVIAIATAAPIYVKKSNGEVLIEVDGRGTTDNTVISVYVRKGSIIYVENTSSLANGAYFSAVN